MIRSIAQLLPYIIAGLFGLALLLFLISIQQLRRGRTGPYWRIRREAGQRGGQLFLLSFALFGIAVALAVFSGLADLAYQRIKAALENSDPNTVHGVVLSTATFPVFATKTATPTVTSSATSTPTVPPDTDTPQPTLTATMSATLSPSLTPTVTLTASPTFENVLVLTIPTSAVQSDSSANISITGAGTKLAADGTPADAGHVFPANTKRIYLFFSYRDITPGVTWTRILYRDGIPIQGQTYLWSLATEGTDFFFFGSENGYPAGQYEVKLFLGDFEISQFTFTLTE